MKINTYIAKLIWNDTLETKTVNVAVIPQNYDEEQDPLSLDDNLFFSFREGEEMIGDHGDFSINSVEHADQMELV